MPAVPSALSVSDDGSARESTNLVIEDDLLQIFKKLENVFAILNVFTSLLGPQRLG